MERQLIPLVKVPLAGRGSVGSLCAKSHTRRRLQDLGFVPNTEVEVLHKSPAGNPAAYGLRGTVIALRDDEAGQIMVFYAF
ncbi:MAG: ferrous iron transport protein A [Peptococcaceae bacterium]|nr:ferrous iron transport protein A [Peptococcaceae bacterium]